MAAQAFEARDFLKIFLGWGFLGSFSYKHFSYKEALQRSMYCWSRINLSGRCIIRLNPLDLKTGIKPCLLQSDTVYKLH